MILSCPISRVTGPVDLAMIFDVESLVALRQLRIPRSNGLGLAHIDRYENHRET